MEDMEKRTAQYVAIRDALDKLKERQQKEREPLQAILDRLGGIIMKFIDDHKLDNLKTSAGSCYVSTRYTATVADPDAFMRFVKENNQFDLLERRANATAVRDYVKEHNSLPTGVNLNALQSVGVRRPSGSSKSVA